MTKNFKKTLFLFLLMLSLPVQALDYESLDFLIDQQGCVRALGTAKLIELSKDLDSQPLYRKSGDQCQQVNIDEKTSSGRYYGDNQCLDEISFARTDAEFHCSEALQRSTYGNDPQVVVNEKAWRFSPWTTLDFGVKPLEGNSEPYETREIYRSVSTMSGTCNLEMRIFSKSPGATNLKPLLMFHGGSWKYRLAGTISLHSQISHYTDQGFVVFAPFYRLTAASDSTDVEGGRECSGASGSDLLDDAAAALEWIVQNGDIYGARPGAAYVGGQSAGAQLALSLALDYPEDVERALLLYPPTDFSHLLAEYRNLPEGETVDGISALEGFLGQSLDSVDMNAPLVQRNSFPQRVASSPDVVPPVYIIHGGADEQVPVEQAVRLCNAFSGSPEQGPATAFDKLSSSQALQSFECGFDSELQVVTDAEHILDFCVQNDFINLTQPQLADCPAGDEAGIAAVKTALDGGIQWLGSAEVETATSSDSGEREATNADVASAQDSRSKGGGAVGLLPFLFIGLTGYLRRRICV